MGGATTAEGVKINARTNRVKARSAHVNTEDQTMNDPTKAAMTPEKIEQGRKLLVEAWPKNGKPLDPFARETFENEWTIPAADALAWLVNNAPALLVAAELGMASRWIPVTERLPEFGAKASGIKRESCITLSEAGVIAMNWTENTYAVTAKGKRPRWEWNHRVSPWVVTHWMPLPPPPTPEQP